jgi:serine/threonine protein kinase
VSGRSQVAGEGLSMGTVGYMSPEQARGEPVDYQTDIWSLGVSLYEVLTGHRAFSSDHEAAIIYLILHEESQSIGKIRTDVPVNLFQSL